MDETAGDPQISRELDDTGHEEREAARIGEGASVRAGEAGAEGAESPETGQPCKLIPRFFVHSLPPCVLFFY